MPKDEHELDVESNSKKDTVDAGADSDEDDDTDYSDTEMLPKDTTSVSGGRNKPSISVTTDNEIQLTKRKSSLWYKSVSSSWSFFFIFFVKSIFHEKFYHKLHEKFAAETFLYENYFMSTKFVPYIYYIYVVFVIGRNFKSTLKQPDSEAQTKNSLIKAGFYIKTKRQRVCVYIFWVCLLKYTYLLCLVFTFFFSFFNNFHEKFLFPGVIYNCHDYILCSGCWRRSINR